MKNQKEFGIGQTIQVMLVVVITVLCISMTACPVHIMLLHIYSSCIQPPKILIGPTKVPSLAVVDIPTIPHFLDAVFLAIILS